MNTRRPRRCIPRFGRLASIALILAPAAFAGKPITWPGPVEFEPIAGVPVTWSITRINAPDVVTATVASVPLGPATNADPPVIEVNVESVLLGDTQPGSTRVLWAPTPFWSDKHWTSGPEEAIGRAQQEWSKTAVEMPAVGARFILLGRRETGFRPRFVVESRGRLPLTSELLAQAKAACAREGSRSPERPAKPWWKFW